MASAGIAAACCAADIFLPGAAGAPPLRRMPAAGAAVSTGAAKPIAAGQLHEVHDTTMAHASSATRGNRMALMPPHAPAGSGSPLPQLHTGGIPSAAVGRDPDAAYCCHCILIGSRMPVPVSCHRQHTGRRSGGRICGRGACSRVLVRREHNPRGTLRQVMLIASPTIHTVSPGTAPAQPPAAPALCA